MKQLDYDVAIIGGGSGGYAAARTTAAAGLRTVVIEGGAEIGGLCILRGCMPTKALLYSTEVQHLAQHAGTWGIQTGKVGFDFPAVMARKDMMVKEFADHRAEQLNSGKFEFVRAQAGFVDPHTLSLNSGKSLTAKNFVISTGSVVAPFPHPALAQIDCLDSDKALSLRKLPKSLIILGGGSVAVEFAQFFSRMRVEVTLIQRSSHILRDMDSDAATELTGVFRREGMTVFTDTKITGATRHDGLKQISFQHAGKTVWVGAAEVLFAMGRIPNTASLGLDKAGVVTEDHRIVTNDEMRTSAPHIFAAGDCTSVHEVVHLAVIQGEICAHNVASPRQPRVISYRLASSIVFTEPQVAVVGLTEKAAAAQKIPYLAASYRFADHGKSLLMEAKDGFVKLLADPATGEILGGCCVGPLGGELIHEIIVGMSKRMTVRELAAIPHYHPTLAEIWTYPAEELAERIPV